MKSLILEKIERHAPKLSELVATYRQRPEEQIRAAIVNTVLSMDARYLDRDEILYLAWLKSSYDHRMRELDDAIRRRWQEKERREQRRMRAAPLRTERRLTH